MTRQQSPSLMANTGLHLQLQRQTQSSSAPISLLPASTQTLPTLASSPFFLIHLAPLASKPSFHHRPSYSIPSSQLAPSLVPHGILLYLMNKSQIASSPYISILSTSLSKWKHGFPLIIQQLSNSFHKETIFSSPALTPV